MLNPMLQIPRRQRSLIDQVASPSLNHVTSKLSATERPAKELIYCYKVPAADPAGMRGGI